MQSNNFNILMDCVSSSQHGSWVSRASVAPNQAEVVFPPMIQPQSYTKSAVVTSLPRSHTLKGGCQSLIRKSMRKGPIFVATFGRHNLLTSPPSPPAKTLANLVQCSLSGMMSSHHWPLTGVFLPLLFWTLILPLMAVPQVQAWFCSSPLHPLRVSFV